LIAQDFRSAHYNGCTTVFSAVAGQDTDLVRAEMPAKFKEFSVAQGFEGTGIPAPPASPHYFGNGLPGDPGFAGPGGCGNEAIAGFNKL
jgi:hypothetical protein